MANIFTPFGFTVLRRSDGAAWTGGMSVYKIAAANTHKFYNGDPVTSLSSGYIDVVASGTTQIAGIFIGCKYFSTARGYPFPSAQFPGGDTTTDVEAYVIDDPWATFKVQVGASAAVGGPAVQGDIMNNFGFQFGTPNTSSGISGAYLDYSNKGVTTTLPFRLINLITFPPGYNGSDGTTAGNFVEVAFNYQNGKSLTGI